MVYCRHCGDQIPVDSIFCPSCGQNLLPEPSNSRPEPAPGDTSPPKSRKGADWMTKMKALAGQRYLGIKSNVIRLGQIRHHALGWTVSQVLFVGSAAFRWLGSFGTCLGIDPAYHGSALGLFSVLERYIPRSHRIMALPPLLRGNLQTRR